MKKEISKANNFSRLKDRQGITLIALVITIVILLILAAVSIRLLTGSNIIDRANEAAEKNKIAQYLEELNVEKMNYMTNKSQNLNFDYKVKEFLQFAIDDKVIKEENVENFNSLDDNVQNTIVQIEKYQYLVEKENNGNIKITYKGKVNKGTILNVEITVNEYSTDSITVNVTAKDNKMETPKNLTYYYYIAKEGENYSGTPNEKTTSNSYKFTNLEQDTNYKIKVETKDKSNNEGQTEITQKTKGVPTGYISIEAQWSDGLTGARISKSSDPIVKDFNIQYQVNTVDGEWKNVNSGDIVTDVVDGDTIFVRLIDNKGNAGGESSTLLTDNTKPEITLNYYGDNPVSSDTNLEIYYDIIDNESGIDLSNSRWTLSDTDYSNDIEYLKNIGRILDSSSGLINTTISEWAYYNDNTYYITILAVDNKGNYSTSVIQIYSYSSSSSLNTGDYIMYYPDYGSYTYTRDDGNEVTIKNKMDENDNSVCYSSYFVDAEPSVDEARVLVWVPISSLYYSLNGNEFMQLSNLDNCYEAGGIAFNIANINGEAAGEGLLCAYDFGLNYAEGQTGGNEIHFELGDNSKRYEFYCNISNGCRILTGINSYNSDTNEDGVYILENGILKSYTKSEIEQMNDLVLVIKVPYNPDLIHGEIGSGNYYIGNPE